MHPTRKAKAVFNLTKAITAFDAGDVEAAKGFADRALKFINGDEGDALPYADHVRACDAFLEQTGFPTLAVAAVYIENWRARDDG